MKLLMTIFLLCFSFVLASGKEVELKSKDGRTIKVTVKKISESSVAVARADGKEFTISFDKLSKKTVTMLKEQKEKIEAEAAAAEAAELARIPKFPPNPKGPDDLPQKIVFKMEEGKTFYVSLTALRGHWIEPKTITEEKAEKDGPYLKVSSAFGGGEGRLFLEQKIIRENLTFKYMTRNTESGEFSAPKKVTVKTSLKDPAKKGSASFSFFSETVPSDTKEVVLFDFKAEE